MLFSYKIRMKCGALAHIEGKLFAQKKKKKKGKTYNFRIKSEMCKWSIYYFMDKYYYTS